MGVAGRQAFGATDTRKRTSLLNAHHKQDKHCIK